MLGHLTLPKEIKTVKRDKICPLEIWMECLGNSLSYKDPRALKNIRNILRGLEGWEENKSGMVFGRGYGNQRGFKKVKKE